MLYYLDTVIVIYAVEGNPADKKRAKDHLDALEQAGHLIDRHPHIRSQGFPRCLTVTAFAVGREKPMSDGDRRKIIGRILHGRTFCIAGGKAIDLLYIISIRMFIMKIKAWRGIGNILAAFVDNADVVWLISC